MSHSAAAGDFEKRRRPMYVRVLIGVGLGLVAGLLLKNGILPAMLSAAEMDELFRRTEQTPGYKLTADLPSQTIRDDAGLKFSFSMDPFRKDVLLKGLDDIGLTLQHADQIAAFEKTHRPTATMYEAVDMQVTDGKK